MTEHNNIYMALAAAQGEMEPVKKGALNPAFKGEGKPKGTPYADLADVVQAVAPSLSKHGIAFYHYIPIDNGQVMITALVHGPTETRVECAVPLVVDRNNMHGFKSATTYAKRIGLESVTGVAPEDDDGNDAAKNPPAKSRAVSRTPHDHDPQTGEVMASDAPFAPEVGNENTFRSGQSFVDQVYARCSKGENSPPNEKAQKTADLLIEKIRGYKSLRGLSGFLAEHQKTIASLHGRFPAICQTVTDANNAQAAWIEAGCPDHVGSEFGLPPVNGPHP